MRPLFQFWLLWLLVVPLAGFPQSVSGAEDAAARYTSEEATLTLVAEEPDANGDFRVALVIDLAAGWKTYWTDPGDAGIPPSIDLSGSRNAIAQPPSFPAPHRFGDAFGSSNGYSQPMAVALRMREELASEKTEIRAKVFIGVCRDICIPVSADLVAIPGKDRDGMVASAFAALPGAGDPAHRIVGAALSSDLATLTVSVITQNADEADVFVAGPEGWGFGTPAPAIGDGDRWTFALPVQSKPRHAQAASAPPFDIVLTSQAGAVEARAVIATPMP